MLPTPILECGELLTEGGMCGGLLGGGLRPRHRGLLDQRLEGGGLLLVERRGQRLAGAGPARRAANRRRVEVETVELLGAVMLPPALGAVPRPFGVTCVDEGIIIYIISNTYSQVLSSLATYRKIRSHSYRGALTCPA